MQHSADPPKEPESDFLATLTLAKSGNEQALNELFGQFYKQVSHMVHARLASDLRVNRPWLSAQFSTGDVVQEVFGSVMSDLSAFQGQTERSFAGYLAMVIRNRIIDAVRFHEADRRDGRRRSGSDVPHQEDQRSPDPAQQVIDSEQVAAFDDAMAELEPRERVLVEARLDGSVSFRELTEYLGFSSESAARRAHLAARAKLAVKIHAQTEPEAPLASGRDAEADA